MIEWVEQSKRIAEILGQQVGAIVQIILLHQKTTACNSMVRTEPIYLKVLISLKMKMLFGHEGGSIS